MGGSPVVLVHGICMRDKGLHRSRQWGRIPQALRDTGHAVVFGNQDAWGTTASNAEQIGDVIELAASQSPDGQVIVIGHSKGGLDGLAACDLERTRGKVRDAFRHVDCIDERGINIPLEFNGERYESIVDLVCSLVEEMSA